MCLSENEPPCREEEEKTKIQISADRNVKDKNVAGWLNDEKGDEATHFFDLVTMRMIVNDEKHSMDELSDQGRTNAEMKG